MAGQRPGGFPLLVSGDWGSAEPPPALKKKLLCYFQSQKRSGGGECELRPGTATGQFLVCFVHPEVKQRVLERQSHQLSLGEKGQLKLVVTDPDRALAAEEEASKEKIAPTKALNASSNLQTKEALQKAESLVRDLEPQEEPKSAENVPEKSPVASPPVVFENMKRCNPKCLRMLLENVSGLTVDDDFTVEVIPEINAAVATFIKSIDTEEFVKKCSQNKRLKEFEMTARLLELTQSIKAENIPASVSADYLMVYFESARNGAGTVSDIQLSPEENSAIITFGSHKDLSTVLGKQHFLEQTLISVHPYYHSLGTALYGEERPTIKMPEPIGVPLDPYVWQFLQRQAKLIQDINQQMAICCCELKWPQEDCAHPEITLCPSSSLSEQNKPLIKVIKTWKQDVSTEFSRIMARYKAIKCRVNSVGWEDLKNRLMKDAALIVIDISEDMVAIAGSRAAVDSAEKEVRECMEKATEESEREKQSVEISMPVIPGKYAILHKAGLEDDIHKEYPGVKISYDDTQKTVQLCGLPVEVYKIKADLLEKVLNIPCTSVSSNPSVLHYLHAVDSRKMSELLFASQQINAYYELENDTVVLYGNAHKDLSEAENQIKTSLYSVYISVEDGEVTKKEQWSILLASLCKKHNSSQQTVLIDQPVGNKVIIAGFTNAVKDCSQKLSDFIYTHAQVEKVIPVKSEIIVQFVEKLKSDLRLELKGKGVTVCFDTKTPCISVRGPRAEVLKAVTRMEEILSSLHLKIVSIDKPGAKDFFSERKDSYIFEAKQKFSCLIRLVNQPQHKDKKGHHEEETKLYYRTVLPGGVVVLVYKGDLCTHAVDVVVNASNEDLKHIGGLAKALLKAAGPELQQECDELVKKNGRFQPGCAVITGAGKLPCKNVIHAVGPRWNKDDAEKCMYLLRKTVKKTLQLAETYNHSSIVLPAISGGIFGFPLQICVNSIVSSIKETLEESMGDSSLKEVHLMDTVEETVQVLSETVKKVFTSESSSSMPLMQHFENHKLSESQDGRREDSVQMDRDDLRMVVTNEGLRIRVKQKDVQEATTDVVVNSVGTDLQFGVGPLCKALLEKAGQALQVEFDKEKKIQNVKEGSVLCTSGCALACKSVLHTILPRWDGTGGRNLKILEDVIDSCLQKAEELGLSSITFPAIGTGGFQFPKTIVSRLMFDGVFKFSSSHAQKTLQEVHFLLHPKDTDNIQSFTIELDRRVAESCSAADPESSYIKPVSTQLLATGVMQIGSITLQVLDGDITKEDTEVIVNVTNATFDAKSGVSKAIMDAAGSQVTKECAQHAGKCQSGFITTQGGNLLCSKIIHLIHNNSVKSQVSKVLQECEQKMYQSVALPAIGTGQAGHSPAKVADDMLDAIVEFASKILVKHLKNIKIIIFQKKMLGDFYESMKKRENSGSPRTDSWMSMFKSLIWGKKQSTGKKKAVFLEKKVDIATFQICGENEENVNATASWIKDLISKDQFETIISDELIENLLESKADALTELQTKNHVALQYENKSSPQIKISGIAKDVYYVVGEIQKLIQKLKSTEEEQSKAELVYNLVEWSYSDSNGSFVSFDKLTNMKLEDAKIAKKKHLTVKINKKNYSVDLNALQACDDQGKTLSIQRIPKNEDKQLGELPVQWEDMQEQRVKLVNLTPSCQEYLEVQNKFKKTCPNFVIEKIERIQNPFLWRTYELKKASLCTKNKSQNNEKLLFHGTARCTLSTINYNGFDRGYAGKNAAVIGNGTYFAVNASYSARDVYSSPDQNNRKYMYLARVLTGCYCAGRSGLIAPPPKNPADPTDLYDSVVDDVNNPTMFVIFNDIQAYPEYLITFKK
ncbi:protein mono-ADP-ribosyltransferase PARP14 [Porphyrio hochstetteri]